MLSWVWIASSLAASLVFLQENFAEQLRSPEIFIGAIPLGLLSSTWLVFLLSSAWYYTLDARSIWACCVLQWLYLDWVLARRNLRAARGRHQEASPKRFSGRKNFWLELVSDRVSLCALALLGTGLVCCWPICSAHFALQQPNGDWASSGGSWGDIPLHLHVMASFLHGSNEHFWYRRIDTPFHTGKLLAYPFLCDFHAAALVVGGFSWRDALRIPSWLLSASSMPLLFLLGERLTGSIRSALLSTGLMVWSGGTGFVEFAIKYGWRRLFLPEEDDDPIQINGFSAGADIFWFGFLGHIMVPQRSMAFALPTALVSFLLLAASLEPGTDLDTAAHSIFWAAALAAVLPLCHAHLYMVAGIIGATLFLLDMQRWRQLPKLLWQGWIPALCVFVGLGAPQILFYLSQLGSQVDGYKFSAFAPDQLAGFNGHFWRTWIRALGVQVPLYVFSVTLLGLVTLLENVDAKSRWLRNVDALSSIMLPRCHLRKDGRWRLKLVCPFATIFIVANLVRFQPWEKDNIKIFHIWLIQASIWNAAVLKQLYAALRERRWLRLLLLVGTVSSMLSGFFGMRKEIAGLRIKHISAADAQVGQWIREHTPPNAVVLTGEYSLFSPAACVAGRPLYVGPDCYARSHGITEWGARIDFLRRVNEGDIDESLSILEALRSRFIKYVLFEPNIGPSEFASAEESESIRLVYAFEGWRLFEIDGVESESRPIEEIPRHRLLAALGLMISCLLTTFWLRCKSKEEMDMSPGKACMSDERARINEIAQASHPAVVSSQTAAVEHPCSKTSGSPSNRRRGRK